MSEICKVKLNRLNDWIINETTPIIEPLRKEAKKLLEDIKDRFEELIESTDKLLNDAEKEMNKGSRKTFRRAKALYKLAESFSDIIEKISFPENINGKILKNTSEQIKKTLKTIKSEKTKWFRAIAPYFIISRRRFEISYKRTEDSFNDFSNFLTQEYIEANEAEETPSKIQSLYKILNNLKNTKKTKKSLEKDIEHLTKEIEKKQITIQQIKNKTEIVELGKLNTQIEVLNNKLKHELRHIKKPLLKLQSLVNNPGYSLPIEATKKLGEYLTNPFFALATEKNGYPILKSILQKVDTALKNKKMKLKTSRLRKAKEQINIIVNKNSLKPLYEECKITIIKKNELTTSNVLFESNIRKNQLNNQLQTIIQKKKILENRINMLSKKYNNDFKRFTDIKKRIEDNISDILQKELQIILE